MNTGIKLAQLLVLTCLVAVGCSQNEGDGRNIAEEPPTPSLLSEQPSETGLTPKNGLKEQAIDDSRSETSPVATAEQSHFPRLEWVDEHGKTIRELAVPSTLMIQAVDLDGKPGNEALVTYSQGSQKLVDLETGEASASGLKPWMGSVDPFGNDYGVSELFADQWSQDLVYGVLGNREVFSSNRKTGQMGKHYVSDKPIYGIASSPDSKRFALLIPSDDFVGPEADLIVFDRSGKELWRKDKVAYFSHSEGFVFPYSMSWPEEHTIVVPANFIEGELSYPGKAFVSINEDKVVTERNDTLPDEVFQRFANDLGEIDIDSLTRVLPGSAETNSEGKYVVQGSSSITWLIDTVTSEVTLLGGTPLLWNAKGELIMWQGATNGYIQLVGLD